MPLCDRLTFAAGAHATPLNSAFAGIKAPCIAQNVQYRRCWYDGGRRVCRYVYGHVTMIAGGEIATTAFAGGAGAIAIAISAATEIKHLRTRVAPPLAAGEHLLWTEVSPSHRHGSPRTKRGEAPGCSGSAAVANELGSEGGRRSRPSHCEGVTFVSWPLVAYRPRPPSC